MAARAFITGLEGLTLSPDERAFLRDARPWGVIIFKRNVSTAGQERSLFSHFGISPVATRPCSLIRKVAGSSAWDRRTGPLTRPVHVTGLFMTGSRQRASQRPASRAT